MVGRIPRTDLDPDAGGPDVDSRTNVDTDARCKNAGRWSHTNGWVDVGTARVPAPCGRFGGPRSDQRQPDQKHQR